MSTYKYVGTILNATTTHSHHRHSKQASRWKYTCGARGTTTLASRIPEWRNETTREKEEEKKVVAKKLYVPTRFNSTDSKASFVERIEVSQAAML